MHPQWGPEAGGGAGRQCAPGPLVCCASRRQLCRCQVQGISHCKKMLLDARFPGRQSLGSWSSVSCTLYCAALLPLLRHEVKPRQKILWHLMQCTYSCIHAVFISSLTDLPLPSRQQLVGAEHAGAALLLPLHSFVSRLLLRRRSSGFHHGAPLVGVGDRRAFPRCMCRGTRLHRRALQRGAQTGAATSLWENALLPAGI